MQNAAPKAIAVNCVVDDVLRRDRGRLLSGLIARLGDSQLAEHALQEAETPSLNHRGRSGSPDNPAAWPHLAAWPHDTNASRAPPSENRKH